MAFRVELATLAGAPLGQPSWRGLTIERTLNGGTLVACEVDRDDQTAGAIALGSRALRVWEGDDLRFHGKLREPLVRRPESFGLTAGSPYTLLDRRQLQAKRVFTNVDQGAIIANLLTTENSRSPTRLRMGDYSVSVARSRTYEAGKSIQEILAELAAVVNGFYFTETPIADAADSATFAELVLAYPGSGVDRGAVRFEYGEGTLGNVEDFTVTEALPVNGVSFRGGSGTTLQRVIDAPSIVTYDLLEEWRDDPDVSVTSTLLEKAQDAIRPAPESTVEVSIVPGGEAVGAPPVPKLWDDFDVGDVVHVSIRDVPTEFYDLPLRVTNARLQISELDDAELLDLTLEAIA